MDYNKLRELKELLENKGLESHGKRRSDLINKLIDNDNKIQQNQDKYVVNIVNSITIQYYSRFKKSN